VLSYYTGWNYILELYFWIIIVALLIVSVTIFFARPKPSASSILEIETMFGTGLETDTISEKNTSNLKSEKEISEEPEEEEKDPEVIIAEEKRKWSFSFAVFGLVFVMIGGILQISPAGQAQEFMVFLGSCMIYVGIMSLLKGISFQIPKENTIINTIMPISIFGINFFLLDVLLDVISQAWMVQSDERKFGNIFLVYGLPYLLWKAVPSFNKETTENNDTETQRRSLLHKRAQKYYYQYGELSLLKLNIKFVLFTFSIFWLTNHLFVMPNLRQYSKVGFDIGLDLLTVILIFSILITIFTSQRNFIWQDKNLAKTNAPINSNNNLKPEILTKEGRAIRDFAEENEDEYFSEEYDADSKEGED